MAVVEVPSRTDSYDDFRLRLGRLQSLGAVVYVVSVEGLRSVTRLGLDDFEPLGWAGKPMPELGGISASFDDDAFVVRTEDGVEVSSDVDLVDALRDRAMVAEAQAEAAHGQAEAAHAQAEAALARMEALADRLRQAGIDPDD